MRKALVLAAGEGSRLRPLTLERPKPMLTVGGAPVLEHVVNWLRFHGISEIAINLHHRPQPVMDYFGDGRRWQVHITYSLEEPILGTAGAAKKLESFWDSAFVVAYGDVLTDLDLGSLIAFHETCSRVYAGSRPAVTMALYQVPNPWECGIVDLDARSRVVRFVEKPERAAVFSNLANAGILAVEPGVLQLVPPDTFFDFGKELFPLLLARGYPIFGRAKAAREYLLDIGSLDKYRQAEEDFRSGRFRPASSILEP